VHDFGTCKQNAAAHVPTSDLETCLAAKRRKSPSAFCLQVPKSCADLDPTLLFIWIFRTYSKFEFRGKKMLALSVCFPQSCARALAAGLPRQDHVWMTTKQSVRFHNNKFDGKPCELDSTEYARSFEPNPSLPEEVQKVFEIHIYIEHRIFKIYIYIET